MNSCNPVPALSCVKSGLQQAWCRVSSNTVRGMHHEKTAHQKRFHPYVFSAFSHYPILFLARANRDSDSSGDRQRQLDHVRGSVSFSLILGESFLRVGMSRIRSSGGLSFGKQSEDERGKGQLDQILPMGTLDGYHCLVCHKSGRVSYH